MYQPMYYQYEVRAAKDGESAEVIARGDLNGDGKTSSFVITIKVKKDKDRTLPYLRTTVVNQARSAARRERTAARHQPPVERPAGSAEEVAVARLDREAVLAALARLPSRQRAAIVLRHYLRMTEGEIAETMGCNVGTVRTHLKRANLALTTSLGGQA